MTPTAITTRKHRSPAAPAYSIEHCFNAASGLHAQFGKRPFDQRGMAGALDLSAGASTTDRLVSSLRQFGLLEKDGHSLALTDRARALLAAISKGDHAGFREIALEAMDESPLFRDLRSDFGAKLPPMEALIARLEKSGFTARSARQAAHSLSESMRFTGILDDDDNIISDLRDAPITTDATVAQHGAGSTGGEESAEVTPIEEVDFEESAAADAAGLSAPGEEAFLARPRIDVPLTDGRMASVLYPAGLSRADVEKIYGVLDALIQA